MLEALWLVPLGFAVGAYGTLIGAGGGFVLMPALLLLYPGESSDVLTGISLTVVFFNALSGSAAYARMRKIDYRSGLILAAATVPGAILGALTTGLVPRRAFDGVLGVILIGAAVFLMARPSLGRRAPAGAAAGASPPAGDGAPETNRLGTYSLRLAVGLSLLVGYVSSLLGIGGGIIHVPVLVGLLGFPVHVATATSHFVLVLTALAGAATHAATGSLGPGVGRVVFLAAGVVAGAQLGAWLSPRSRGRWILRGLAAALALVGARVLVLAFQTTP